MKHNDYSEIVHPYAWVTTSCYYEMEIWVYNPKEESSDDDMQDDLNHYGVIKFSAWRDSVGIYRTKEEALEYLNMISEDPLPDGNDILVVYIRQKPVGIQMDPHACLKEWTYVDGVLHDETIVRNYDLDNNRFYGRPQEMIRHKVGDIVVVAEGGNAHWGIVCSLPPTPEEVKKVNDRSIAKGRINEGDSLLDYSDDCYIILLLDEKYKVSHEHIQANRIIPGWKAGIPDSAKAILEKEIGNEQNDCIYQV